MAPHAGAVVTWREAAVGIEPWDGCALLDGGRCASVLRGVVMAQNGPRVGVYDRSRLPCRVENAPPPDLADADTRAMFDRRLALHLGAPVEAVDEGIRFYPCGRGRWRIDAGCDYLGDDCNGEPYLPTRWGAALNIDTLDPLTARCLAWKSVPG